MAAIIKWTYHNSEALSQKIGLSQCPAVLNFPDHDFNRLEYLCACLAAVKSFLQLVLAMPASTHHTVTVPMILQIIWNSGTLHQLATFEHPDWDPGLVVEAFDFFKYIRKFAETMQMAKKAIGYDPHTDEHLDFWSKGADALVMLEGMFEGRLPNPDDLPVPQSREYGTTNFSGFTTGVDFMDVMDDVWMGPSDFQRW